MGKNDTSRETDGNVGVSLYLGAAFRNGASRTGHTRRLHIAVVSYETSRGGLGCGSMHVFVLLRERPGVLPDMPRSGPSLLSVSCLPSKVLLYPEYGR